MSQMYFKPIVTGVAQAGQEFSRASQAQGQGQGGTFEQVLQGQLQARQEPVSFSKHAAQRVAQRGIQLPEASMARLHEGLRLAEEKGIDGNTLILVDQTAFVVNVKNNKVITALQSGELAGSVFTNIDGTVII